MKKIIVIFMICCLSLTLLAQPQPDKLEAKVKQYIQWMDKEAEVWKAANRLVSLEAKAVPLIKLQIPTLEELPKVGCAKALIVLKEKDYGLDILLDVLENGQNTTARRQAAVLVGAYGNLSHKARLTKILNACFDPQVKIATAKTLWQVAKRTEAVRVLRDYTQSDKEEIKYAAAIALGEIGNVGEVKKLLSEIKDEPTPRGQMALILLNQEKTIVRYERLLKEKEQPADATPSTPSTPTPQNLYPTFHEVLEKIQTCHIYGDKFTKEILEDTAIRAIASKADNYSEFWDEKEWAEFTKTMEREEYVGIGVYVEKQEEHFVISGVIYTGPAYKAGVRTNDRLLAIDGWQTKDRNMDELVKRIQGTSGTQVRLTLYRVGWAQERELTIPRENVKLPHLFYQLLPGKIGYIYLTQFGQKAPEDVENALKNMEAEGMKAAIIDLRDNHGGWLKAAVDIVDGFLPGGQMITYSEGRHPVYGRRNDYISTNKRQSRQYPVVILVNGSSASASEIVAGSMQCHKRAIIVGQQSYGKGSVQQPLELDTRPDTRLKLTVAMYYLPNGACIHNEIDSSGKVVLRRGIMPDVVVEKPSNDPWKNEERAKLEAKKVLQSYIVKYYASDSKLLQQLAENDQGSTAQYPDFAAWYATLETKASQDDVRRWLREHLRQYVAEDRGREYACDYVEDIQLQRAILESLKSLEMNAKDFPEYQNFANAK